LLQYSLGVKRDEMRKLEDIAQAEEKKLELAEQYLEEDAALFDEFLKENDRNASEAIKVYASSSLLFWSCFFIGVLVRALPCAGSFAPYLQSCARRPCAARS